MQIQILHYQVYTRLVHHKKVVNTLLPYSTASQVCVDVGGTLAPWPTGSGGQKWLVNLFETQDLLVSSALPPLLRPLRVL